MRLHQQAVMWWPKELPAMSRLAGLHDGLAVADVGCGPGFLSGELLTQFPNLEVTGVELDPKLLAIANSGNRRFGLRWKGVQASVDSMAKVASSSMDVVILRYLVQHLPDPEAAFAEVRRILVPGGRVVVIDIDSGMSGIIAPGQEFARLFSSPGSRLPEAMTLNRKLGTMFDALEKQQGGDRQIGRRLWSLLQASGFKQLSQEVAMITSAEYGLPPFKKLLQPDPRAWKFYRKGMLTLDELKLNEEMLDAFFADEGSSINDLEFIVVGTN